MQLRVVLATMFLSAGALTIRPAPASAQTDGLDALVRNHSYIVRFDGKSMGGPGAELLFELAGRAQFVALGEEHNTREIPLLTTAMFTELQVRHGYRFLAIEQDPVAMRMVSRPPLRGAAESIRALSDQYPYAFTFSLDEELGMLAAVGSVSQSKSTPIWGCDQAFGATHILDRLLEAVPPDQAEKLTALRAEAAEHERVRDLEKSHYMARQEKSSVIAAMCDTFDAGPGSETQFLLESLRLSDRIYAHYREERYYQNNLEREQYMKARFMDEYRQAAATQDSPPRVLLKFGHWHVYRGLGPSNVQTLGNFVSEVATLHGMESLHIAIFPNNEPGEYGDLSRWQDAAPALLAHTLSRAEWMLVDLRALRPHFWSIRSEVPAKAVPALSRWIFGFDFALFIGGMQPGGRE